MEIVYLILIIGGLAAQFFYLRSYIRRAVRQPESLQEVRKEIDALITELNQNADRNLTLMEQRLGQIQQVLTEADRRLVLLKKEETKSQASAQIYSHLQKAKPLVTSEPPQVQVQAAEVSQGTPTPPIPAKSVPKEEPPQVKSTAQKVRELFGEGRDAPQIARTLGITLGEVELILSLQKGSRG